MPYPNIRALALAGCLAGSFAAGALAQTPVQPQPKDPNMPAPRNTVPEKIEPGTTTGTLSERLERSDGVIKPSDPGTGRVLTPPNQDASPMPVVPPNGTPGSIRPNVDPK